MAQIRSASAELIAFFETGDIPTADNFSDLILSTAVYDGTLPIISGSNTGTGSFAHLEARDNVGSHLIPHITNLYDLGSQTYDWRNLFVSGTIGVGTIANLSGSTQANTTITVSSSLAPSATNLWNLGTSALKWNLLHVSGVNIGQVSSSLIPGHDDTWDLGSSTFKWKNLYVDGIAYIDNIQSASADVLTVNSNISSSLIPSADDAFDLGSSGAEWKDLYVDGTAYIDTLSISALDDGVSITGISCSAQVLSVSGTIKPQTTNLYDLGTPVLKWKDLHISGTAAMAVIANTSSSIAAGTTITVSSSLTPALTNTFTLGTNALQYKEVFTNSVSASLITGSTAAITTATVTTLTSDTSTLTNATITNITGSTIISGNLTPAQHNSWSLGSTSNHWDKGYMTTSSIVYLHASPKKPAEALSASDIFVSGNLLPQADDVWNLGSGSREWKDLYIDGVAYLDTATVGSASIDRITQTLLPSTDGTKNLGSKAFQFGTGFMVTASISGYVSSSLIPHNDDTYDLGSSGNQWKDLYIDGTANIDTLAADAGSIQTLNTSLSASVYLANFSTSGSAGAGYVSSIRFKNLPTSVAQARLIGTGSLYLSGSEQNDSKALFVFTG